MPVPVGNMKQDWASAFMQLLQSRWFTDSADWTEPDSVLACVVILSVGVSAAWQVQKPGSFELAPSLDKKLVVTAHRGGAATAPENTLAAFQGAIEQGADWVKLDVQRTADGVLVVMHDSSLLPPVLAQILVRLFI